EQVVETVEAQEAKHGLDLGGGVRDEATHASEGNAECPPRRTSCAERASRSRPVRIQFRRSASSGGWNCGTPVPAESGSEPVRRQEPGFTNGGLTTSPAATRPRMSTSTAVPGFVPGGRKARAMPRSSVGERLPLVTYPATWP